MTARKVVCGLAIFLSATIVAAGQAHGYDNGAFAATGPYANMPGQPGGGPEYLARKQQDQLPPPVIIQASDNTANNTASNTADTDSAVNQQPLPPLTQPQPEQPPPPPQQQVQAVPPESITYHDPQKQATAGLAPSPFMSLETRQGIDIGAQVSDYRYHEPRAGGVEIQGTNFGGTVSGTAVVGDHYFGILEGRGVVGWPDYSGGGTLNNQPNTIWEARALLGKDFIFTYFSISPFAGVGYRYLDSDLSGTTNVGTHTYESTDGLVYVPLGIRPHMRLDADSRLTSSLEYDFLISGAETAHLGDTGTGNPTVRADQDHGFGFRGEFMYETKYWSFGPFASYWSFNTSKASVYHSPGSTCGSTTCSFAEPYNHTIEAGVQFKLHFF